MYACASQPNALNGEAVCIILRPIVPVTESWERDMQGKFSRPRHIVSGEAMRAAVSDL